MNTHELLVGLLLAKLLCSIQISFMLLLNLLNKAVCKQIVPCSVLLVNIQNQEIYEKLFILVSGCHGKNFNIVVENHEIFMSILRGLLCNAKQCHLMKSSVT